MGLLPLARYVKLWVAHAPGIPGKFSPPPLVCEPDMHHGTCVTHMPWCMSGSLNVPCIPGACANRDFTYLVRGPWKNCALGPVSLSVFSLQFKFHGNLVSLARRFWHSDRYKSLYRCATVACAKFVAIWWPCNGFRTRRSFHRIWIAGKNR